MTATLHRAAPIPAVLSPSLLGLALLLFSGCGGDEGGLKPLAETEANKANIAAEQADDAARFKKSTKGQP